MALHISRGVTKIYFLKLAVVLMNVLQLIPPLSGFVGYIPQIINNYVKSVLTSGDIFNAFKVEHWTYLFILVS